jgi:RNA polymerase sigma factor (sigma-70 family)
MSRTSDESGATTNRSERGRRSYEEGHSFEDRVVELYRLLHYKVEHGRLFGGRQVDIFLTGRFGDMTIHRAIECKVGQVKSDHIDSFIAKLRMVQREYPGASGTIVSTISFTDAVATQAAQEGIHLTLYRDLAAQLFDGHAYAQGLVREIESNERYPKAKYIEPNIGYEALGDSFPAFRVLEEWLLDSEWQQLTLLGDVGTGKSFLSRMFAHRLATQYLVNPVEAPLPVRIDLRKADREFSLEGLVLTHLAQNGLSGVSFEAFQYSLAQGRIVLILDGFDEMAARVTPQVTNRNFFELARGVQGRAKVLLTCRTHYFKSRTEEEEVILGGKQDYGSETARDLYWELISRKGFKIGYLRPFDIPQIKQYVSRIKLFDAASAMQKIRSTYNLLELSQRPMLLEMIVKSIDKLTASQINAATLYEVFTSAWVYRDKWRDVLSPDAKLSFLTALARSLWHEDLSNIHYTLLFQYVHQNLATQIEDAHKLVEIDSEIRTASFLTRDESGHYGFAHKSYGEFFLARYLTDQLNAGRIDCLHTRRLTPEVINFLGSIVNREKVEPLLEEILQGEYRPFVSENALLCLYGFRRALALGQQLPEDDQTDQNFSVQLPPRVNLKGAQLAQVSLDGAMLIEADLSEANLSEAIMNWVNLTGSNISGANLEKAHLISALLKSVSARSTNMMRTNLEGADIAVADLTGANLTDAYLIRINYEGVELRDVIWQGAVLPEKLKEYVERLTNEHIRLSLQVGSSESLDKFWTLIVHLRPYMMRVAGLTGLLIHIDPEDIVHDAIIRLASPPHLERLTELDEAGQKDYVYFLMRRSLLSQEAMVHRRNDLAETPRPDDEEFEDIDVEKYNDDVEDVSDLESEAGELKLESPESEYLQHEMPLVSTDELDEYNNEGLSDDFVDSVDMIASEIEDFQQYEKVLSLEIRKVLSERVWRIVEEHYMEGFTLEEIAADEGIEVSNVKAILSKAREILRRQFSADY